MFKAKVTIKYIANKDAIHRFTENDFKEDITNEEQFRNLVIDRIELFYGKALDEIIVEITENQK